MFMLSSFASSEDGAFESTYKYNLKLTYKSNLNTFEYSHSAMINGKKLTCMCGKDPMLIMIVYGHVQGFCFEHMPQIDIMCQCNCMKEEDNE